MRKNRLVLIIGALVALVLIVTLALFWSNIRPIINWALSILEKKEAIRQFVQSLGPLGPIGFILLQALQVVLSPIPGEATGVVGGFLFGKWLGLLYSTIGLGLGSFIAFSISRHFRRYVEGWLKKSEWYWKLEGLLEHQGIFICFFLFVFPGFPKDFLCYFLGLTRMPWQVFVFISTVGRIPGTLMLSWQGAELYNGNWVGVISILVITLIVVVPAWYYREKIYAWVEAKAKEMS